MLGILPVLDVYLMGRDTALDNHVPDDRIIPRCIHPESKKAALSVVLEFDTGSTAYGTLGSNRRELPNGQTSEG
jgi:hypothetical protein